jgi:hypothetical protein
MIKFKKLIVCSSILSILLITGCVSNRDSFVENQEELNNLGVCRNYVKDKDALGEYIVRINSEYNENILKSKNRYHNPRLFYRPDIDLTPNYDLRNEDSKYLYSLGKQIKIRNLSYVYCEDLIEKRINKIKPSLTPSFSWNPF